MITKDKYSFGDFVKIIEQLRGENGCDWDRAQTHESLLRYLIEESYEYIEAVKQNKPEKQADELGDVLLQVVLNAQIAAENGEYTIDDVINCVAKKMIYRHPHVFKDVKVNSVGDILNNWEELKKKENGGASNKEMIKSLSHELPLMIRTQKILKKLKKIKREDLYSELIDKDLEDVIANSDNPKEKINRLFITLAKAANDYGVLSEMEINLKLDEITDKIED